MHFVDQIHLVASNGWRITGVIEDLAHVVDAGVRCGIELEQINKSPRVDIGAGRADTARRRRDALDAVKALGKYSRNGGLAHSARTCQEIRVMQSTTLDCVRQRRN